MNHLLLIQFASEADAEEARHELMARCSRQTTDITNAVIATKTPVGNIRVNQLMSSSATAFPPGGVHELLVGILYWPSARMAADARSKAVSDALLTLGLETAFLAEASEALQSGRSTLLMLLLDRPPEDALALLTTAVAIRATPYDETRELGLRSALEGLRRAPHAAETGSAKDDVLDAGLEHTFPASDPVSAVSAAIPAQRTGAAG